LGGLWCRCNCNVELDGEIIIAGGRIVDTAMVVQRQAR
jgi:hypothetical protein